MKRQKMAKKLAKIDQNDKKFTKNGKKKLPKWQINEQKWQKITKNASKWQKMDENGKKYYKLVTIKKILTESFLSRISNSQIKLD